MSTWQRLPEHISPIFFRIGSFELRYYGLMYLLSFLVVYGLIRYRLKHENFSYKPELIDDYFFWSILGTIIGARLGYVLFYNFDYYRQFPSEIILPFDIKNHWRFVGISGMSFHGGLIGVVLASLIFCAKRKINFWDFGDFIVPTIPLGYMFGRIGNFLNGELYGRVTSVSWGMIFPGALDSRLRHPSQLYEAFFEGFILFIILWVLRKKELFRRQMIPLYLIGYGTIRFFIEYFREPDEQLGLLFGAVSLGQILCMIMVFFGVMIYTIHRNLLKRNS